jgi:hypothetical protein
VQDDGDFLIYSDSESSLRQWLQSTEICSKHKPYSILGRNMCFPDLSYALWASPLLAFLLLFPLVFSRLRRYPK